MSDVRECRCVINVVCVYMCVCCVLCSAGVFMFLRW